MNKILLISLIMNLVLAYLLVFSPRETKVVERVIIETHADKKRQDVKAETTAVVKEERKKSKPQSSEKEHFFNEPEEFQEAGEKMEEKRKEFFIDKLGMTEDKIIEHNRIRDEFYQQSTLLWQKNPNRELSFKERRDIIDLEEAFHKKLEKLHGKENWNRYLKFRENYNEKGQKRQIEEGAPFIYMGI